MQPLHCSFLVSADGQGQNSPLLAGPNTGARSRQQPLDGARAPCAPPLPRARPRRCPPALATSPSAFEEPLHGDKRKQMGIVTLAKKRERLLHIESVIKVTFKGTWTYTTYKIQLNMLKFAKE